MKRSTYSVSRAQRQHPRLLREADAGRVVGITRRDETVAYLLSRDQLESIVETMELLANPSARRAIAVHRKGKTRFAGLSTVDEE